MLWNFDKFVNLKYIIRKLRILTQNLVDLVSKLPCAPAFRKIGTSCKSNMLILNIVLGTADLGPKLQILENLVPTLKFAPIFMNSSTHNKSNMLIMNIILASV